ncbi:MAG: DUF2325 domain-containing protein [Betaproteobacteria bacterium]|nr:DUF2325 domain-containing protein [Betaproteobacteria bacterium]
MCERHPESAPPPPPEAARKSRRKLWEVEEKYHCPVIGSCLNLDELGRLARKSGYAGKRIEPYELHLEAVSLSLARNDASTRIHKWLEKKHDLAIRRFERAKADAEVLALWKEHLQRGDVAGAFWAVMTHKAAGKETRHTAYADLHMLSHQVGAGQAADLVRLAWLEKERHAQAAEAERQQGQLALKGMEAERLRQALAEAQERLSRMDALEARLTELESGQAIVALGRRLLMAEAESARARELAARQRVLEERVGVLRADKARLTRELDEVRAERDALEMAWTAENAAPTDCSGECHRCADRLAGRCVLCVGGRTPLLPHYRQLAERLGVRLLHHDGGREEHLSRLPDLLNASDAVVCPTDCVGHLAYYQLKKHCKQTNKPCVLAKNSSVAGFAAALTRLAQGRAEIGVREADHA